MKMRITVEGKTYDVDVELLDGGNHDAAVPSLKSAPAAPVADPAPVSHAPAPVAACDENLCVSPLPGTVLKVHVEAGQTVAVNEVLFVLDAMKMETHVPSPRAGTIKAVHVAVGKAVKEGEILLEFA